MTAPFAPPVPWEVEAITLGMVAVMVSLPFARRDDWVGLIAFSTLIVVLVGLWGLLIRGWWRNGSRLD